MAPFQTYLGAGLTALLNSTHVPQSTATPIAARGFMSANGTIVALCTPNPTQPICPFNHVQPGTAYPTAAPYTLSGPASEPSSSVITVSITSPLTTASTLAIFVPVNTAVVTAQHIPASEVPYLFGAQDGAPVSVSYLPEPTVAWDKDSLVDIIKHKHKPSQTLAKEHDGFVYVPGPTPSTTSLVRETEGAVFAVEDAPSATTLAEEVSGVVYVPETLSANSSNTLVLNGGHVVAPAEKTSEVVPTKTAGVFQGEDGELYSVETTSRKHHGLDAVKSLFSSKTYTHEPKTSDPWHLPTPTNTPASFTLTSSGTTWSIPNTEDVQTHCYTADASGVSCSFLIPSETPFAGASTLVQVRSPALVSHPTMVQVRTPALISHPTLVERHAPHKTEKSTAVVVPTAPGPAIVATGMPSTPTQTLSGINGTHITGPVHAGTEGNGHLVARDVAKSKGAVGWTFWTGIFGRIFGWGP